MIASYTNRDLSDKKLPTLAVIGDNEGVMNKNLYDKRLNRNSKDFEEYVITGANHAQFGSYGEQPRDNKNKIPADVQQKQTAEIILKWLDNHNFDKDIGK